MVMENTEKPQQRRVSRASLVRAIKATVDAGLTVSRVIARPDGVSIETLDAPAGPQGEVAKPRMVIL
jgi:hypothetical protein